MPQKFMFGMCGVACHRFHVRDSGSSSWTHPPPYEEIYPRIIISPPIT